MRLSTVRCWFISSKVWLTKIGHTMQYELMLSMSIYEILKLLFIGQRELIYQYDLWKFHT